MWSATLSRRLQPRRSNIGVIRNADEDHLPEDVAVSGGQFQIATRNSISHSSCSLTRRIFSDIRT
eukprot:m.436542 g.436542  ORF g.436542 m.436542 type:complete len:65 (+) comp17990_c0_seq1:765-959(+)